jgi:hypothetical protein
VSGAQGQTFVWSRDGYLCITRPPTAWMLLRPDTKAGMPGSDPVVLPIYADAALPDYVVPKETFDCGRSTRWQVGDRFRMQFGGRKGSWYRGTVVDVRGLGPGPDADPWEALGVRWEDGGGQSATPRVSPWEVEIDPNSIEVLNCVVSLYVGCSSLTVYAGSNLLLTYMRSIQNCGTGVKMLLDTFLVQRVM